MCVWYVDIISSRPIYPFMELWPCFCRRPFDIRSHSTWNVIKGSVIRSTASIHAKYKSGISTKFQSKHTAEQLAMHSHCSAKIASYASIAGFKHKISRTFKLNWIHSRRTRRWIGWSTWHWEIYSREVRKQPLTANRILLIWECLKSLVMKGAEEMSKRTNNETLIGWLSRAGELVIRRI